MSYEQTLTMQAADRPRAPQPGTYRWYQAQKVGGPNDREDRPPRAPIQRPASAPAADKGTSTVQAPYATGTYRWYTHQRTGGQNAEDEESLEAPSHRSKAHKEKELYVRGDNGNIVAWNSSTAGSVSNRTEQREGCLHPARPSSVQELEAALPRRGRKVNPEIHKPSFNSANPKQKAAEAEARKEAARPERFGGTSESRDAAGALKGRTVILKDGSVERRPLSDAPYVLAHGRPSEPEQSSDSWFKTHAHTAAHTAHERQPIDEQWRWNQVGAALAGVQRSGRVTLGAHESVNIIRAPAAQERFHKPSKPVDTGPRFGARSYSDCLRR